MVKHISKRMQYAHPDYPRQTPQHTGGLVADSLTVKAARNPRRPHIGKKQIAKALRRMQNNG